MKQPTADFQQKTFHCLPQDDGMPSLKRRKKTNANLQFYTERNPLKKKKRLNEYAFSRLSTKDRELIKRNARGSSGKVERHKE